MNKINKPSKTKNTNEKREKEIKILEITLSSVVAIISFLGIIFASIAIAKHKEYPLTDIETAITGLIIGIACLLLISYLFFETFYTEKVYDVELTVRSILLIIVILGSIVSIGMGIVSFISIK
jgi:uncharacterized membrane protein YozB (DUF420 family)